jgi:transposase
MRRKRKHDTGEEKSAILRRHLLDKVLVSELCEELGLKGFFENGAAAFQRKMTSNCLASAQESEI